MRKFLFLLAPLAVILTGCFTIENSYVVNEDGSGTQTVRFAVPGEVLSTLGGQLPSLEEAESDPDMQALRAALGDRGSVEFFSNEVEGFGFQMVVDVPASDDFSAALEQVLADLPLDGDLPLDQVTSQAPAILRDGNAWTFSMALEALTDQDVAELAGDDQGAAFASAFLDQSTVTVRVSLPGEMAEHDADEVLEDGTLVWTQQGSTPPRTISARSELPGDSGAMRTVLILAGVLGAAAVAAGLAYLAMRRSSAPEQA
ncbi:MAG: hypothetical protein M0R73_03585 [Dehalococcoidia bacterium]|nr:hypothetical protein [Dehalococcoidia bacterium]